MTDEEKQAELEELKAVRTSTRQAILAITQGAQSYTLDTGQTRQIVTKANLSELKNTYEWLTGEIVKLETDLGLSSGTGHVTYARPAF